MQAKEGGLRRNQTCWCLNLGLPASYCKKMKFSCLSHLICDMLLWQPEQTNTHTHVFNMLLIPIQLFQSPPNTSTLCTVPLDFALSYLGHLPKMFSHLLAPKSSLTSPTTLQNCSGLCWSFAFSAFFAGLQHLSTLLYTLSCVLSNCFLPRKLSLPLRMETSLSPEFVSCT